MPTPVPPPPPPILQLPPGRTAALLLAANVFVAAAYVFFVACNALWLPGHPLFGLPRFFDITIEATLPSYLAALNLLLAGGLLLIITAAAPRAERPPWLVLGAGFIFMSVDEAAQIHEPIIGRSFRSFVGEFESPALYYGWVVIALIACAGIGLAYIPFLRRLPRPYARLFLLSATLFIGGAVGMEIVEGIIVVEGSTWTHWFPWRPLLEEMGEVAGVILFVYSLLRYMKERGVALLIAPAGRPRD